jgi:hypothetical protein
MSDANAIRQAFFAAQSRRPYSQDEAIVNAATPPGGEWTCAAEEGTVTRSIVWGGREVALVNPRGDIDDETEGQIAMAMRALPLMDAALRAIIVLAEDAANLALVRTLAVSCIAFVEMPAPRLRTRR